MKIIKSRLGTQPCLKTKLWTRLRILQWSQRVPQSKFDANRSRGLKLLKIPPNTEFCNKVRVQSSFFTPPLLNPKKPLPPPERNCHPETYKDDNNERESWMGGRWGGDYKLLTGKRCSDLKFCLKILEGIGGAQCCHLATFPLNLPDLIHTTQQILILQTKFLNYFNYAICTANFASIS